jgi:hydroxyacylglutathione hydrolase
VKIERFEIPSLAQYSYVVSAEGKAIVIDPIRDIDRYLEYSSQWNLKITHVVETHIHADFASGATALVAATGAELGVSAYDDGQHFSYSMPHRALRDGDFIDVGTVTIRPLHTPGHTPEHLSFAVFDRDRSKTIPVALLSGDFLFVGSLGRPDLLGEAEKQGLAHELYKSLHDRIASLPDGVELYPGHGAGSLCGAGMSERGESTLGYERATNPLFALSEENFVTEILRTVPPMPDYYPRMKELNAKGAPALKEIPGAKGLTVPALKALLPNNQVTVLDLRRPEAFGGAHIEGSVNIGAGQNLSLWAGWLLDPSKPIVLIADKGDDESSRRSLVRVGLDNISGFLTKGIQCWIDAGEAFSRITQLSTKEVEMGSAKDLVLDVRGDQEWTDGHIEGAQHLMLGDLTKQLASLPRERPITTVCGSGYRSSIAASLLKQRSFSQVSSMDGGMAAWHHQKLPTVR